MGTLLQDRMKSVAAIAIM